jgi:hypothetical protein
MAEVGRSRDVLKWDPVGPSLDEVCEAGGGRGVEVTPQLGSTHTQQV